MGKGEGWADGRRRGLAGAIPSLAFAAMAHPGSGRADTSAPDAEISAVLPRCWQARRFGV